MGSSIVEIRRHLEDLRLRGCADIYVTARRRTLLRMERATGKAALKMTADDLDDYQRRWELAPQSRAVECSHIRGFLVWAVRQRLLRADPSAVLLAPRRPRRLPRPISEENLSLALQHATPKIRAILTLAACQGLRSCELAALTRDDILDRDSPPVVVVAGKGDKQRVIPLGRTTLTALRGYGMPLRGPLFPRPDGQRGHMSACGMSKMGNAYLHDLGLTETMHKLRHRAVTMIYRVERDLRAAQEFAGHADPRTTSGYSAYAPDALIRAVSALDEIGA